MKALSRSGWILVLLSYMFVNYSSLSFAEALLTDPGEKKEPVQKKYTKPLSTAVSGAGNTAPISRSAEVPQTMSCWQYGKLILEVAVLAPKDKVTDVRLMHHPDSGLDMLAFDFKNAFCFIK